MSDSFDEERPIIIVRLVDDTGWSICEHERDRRQPRHRLRPDVLDPRHPVEEVGLQGDRDHLLDLVGREAEGFGLHLDVRGRELGIDVLGRVPELRHAEEEDPHGGRDHEDPEPEALIDDSPHHWRSSSFFTSRRRTQYR
jgi:hypothetical protein